ncbi:hypothetical protein FVEG_17012 [Fusarium verticillioides 7600]|uniref:Uncharacterized protein n=1 Tax=Gibberella moniliformis (strain M3125 / FGSC 7600) TaxID=334819 RepID=W7MXY5_GIBM7|nr:hypothetical protein FVEG_17012 [Fusarium verticillioides 7600]EWG52709.1 hypothetical protein FVEG_17012 [Fusarium verticillioides 7600]
MGVGGIAFLPEIWAGWLAGRALRHHLNYVPSEYRGFSQLPYLPIRLMATHVPSLTSVLRVRPRLIVEAGCDDTAGEPKPKSLTYAEYKDGGKSSIVPAALSFEAWPPSSGHQRKFNCTTDSAPYFASC